MHSLIFLLLAGLVATAAADMMDADMRDVTVMPDETDFTDFPVTDDFLTDGMFTGMTEGPETNAPTTTTVSSTVTTATATTTAATTATTATTTTTTTASTDPPSSSEGTLGLTFSLDRTFSSELANSSSSEFQALAGVVTTELNKAGNKLFPSSYRRSVINSFTNGSVVVDSTIVFKDQDSVPATSDVSSGFEVELTNTTTLNLLEGTLVASSAAGSALLPSMGKLAAITLTLVAMTQILIEL